MMVLSINAAPRSLNQARAIAINKATTLGVDITSASKSIKRSMISTNRQQKTADESFYVFSGTQGKGYVIVAGDDRMPDIVGYSTNDTFICLTVSKRSFSYTTRPWLLLKTKMHG